jgi:5-methylcytosine-specific restriction endonuclease McrA
MMDDEARKRVQTTESLNATKAAKKRDRFTCVICGNHGDEAHHIDGNCSTIYTRRLS